VELEGAGGGAKRPEADGDVAQAVGPVALHDDGGLGRHDVAGVELFLLDAIDNELLRVLLVGSRLTIVQGADDVDLGSML
jgi:hypothetical protein